VLEKKEAGWHNTVNIRVFSLDAWNQIAAEKTLAKVRDLQKAGLAGPDLATNVYFFSEIQHEKK
jgi:hypothetical protein